MRLPWPLSLIQRAPASSGAASAAGRRAVAGGRDSAFVVGGPKRDLGEWRKVPPIKEVVGPPPLVAPNAPFAAELGAGHPPPPILAPLGHGRGLDAPVGLILGVAKAVQRAPDASPRPFVQRKRAEQSRTTSALPVEYDSPQTPPEAPAAAPVAQAAAASEPIIKPRRVVAVAAPLQRAPLQLARVGERQKAAVDSGGVQGTVGQPRLAGGSVPELPAPVERIAPAAGPQVARPEPPARPPLKLAGQLARKPAEPSAPVIAPSVPGRLTLGQSRKLGLGAPIVAAPPTAAPFGADETRLGSPLSTAAQREPASADAPADAPPGYSLASITSAPPSAAALSASPLAARPEPVRARPIASTPRQPAVASAPLVSAARIRGKVQRAPIARGSRPTDRPRDEETKAVPGGPVRVHRGEAVGELAESLQAKAFTHQGEIYLPPSAGPMGSPAARSLIAHELTHVAQQRVYGSRLPQEHSAHGQHLERQAASAEHHRDLPLVMPPSLNSASAGEDHEPDTANAQRKPASGPSGPSVETTTITFPAGVQRAKSDGDRPVQARGTSDQPTESPKESWKSESELEELAGQLYSRISRRLRRELMVDRERAGLMVDLR